MGQPEVWPAPHLTGEAGETPAPGEVRLGGGTDGKGTRYGAREWKGTNPVIFIKGSSSGRKFKSLGVKPS